MTSPIGGISLPTVPTVGPLQATEAAQAAQPAAPASGEGFAAALTGALEQLGALQSTRDDLAVQAATGDLRDVHDYMIAAQESSVATEMVVTLKNKAVEAFTEIMRMPV
ncbi:MULTISPECIES: flagellar hook-basal body complex protein FliE [unclassified Geodermatophilus]